MDPAGPRLARRRCTVRFAVTVPATAVPGWESWLLVKLMYFDVSATRSRSARRPAAGGYAWMPYAWIIGTPRSPNCRTTGLAGGGQVPQIAAHAIL